MKKSCNRCGIISATENYLNKSYCKDCIFFAIKYEKPRDEFGRFRRGYFPFNKGKKNSKKHIENMSLSRKGKHYSKKTEYKQGHTPHNKKAK